MLSSTLLFFRWLVTSCHSDSASSCTTQQDGVCSCQLWVALIRNLQLPLNEKKVCDWKNPGSSHRILGQRVHLRLIRNLSNSRVLRNPPWDFHLSITTGFPAYLLIHYARGPTHLQLRCPPLTGQCVRSPRGKPNWYHSWSCQPRHWQVHWGNPLARCPILVRSPDAWSWKVGSLAQLWKNRQGREQLGL